MSRSRRNQPVISRISLSDPVRASRSRSRTPSPGYRDDYPLTSPPPRTLSRPTTPVYDEMTDIYSNYDEASDITMTSRSPSPLSRPTTPRISSGLLEDYLDQHSTNVTDRELNGIILSMKEIYQQLGADELAQAVSVDLRSSVTDSPIIDLILAQGLISYLRKTNKSKYHQIADNLEEAAYQLVSDYDEFH